MQNFGGVSVRTKVQKFTIKIIRNLKIKFERFECPDLYQMCRNIPTSEQCIQRKEELIIYENIYFEAIILRNIFHNLAQFQSYTAFSLRIPRNEK